MISVPQTASIFVIKGIQPAIIINPNLGYKHEIKLF